MITPQDIQEKTFVKAVFGGYDMESVDEFLEPLTEDYITLYKENSVLKSKMKVLVETIEEYRGTEDTLKKALFTAQKTADELMTETERKCAQLISNAESIARNKVAELQAEIAAEEDRLNRAKRATVSYLDKIKELSRQNIEHMETLAALDVHRFSEAAAAVPETQGDIAASIESSVAKLISSDGASADTGFSGAAADSGDAADTDIDDVVDEDTDDEGDGDSTRRFRPSFEYIDFQEQYSKEAETAEK